jgi:hypothetical protein
VLNELETGFRFNDAVLRHLAVKKEQAETAPSVMMKAVDREEARKSQDDSRRGSSSGSSSGSSQSAPPASAADDRRAAPQETAS